MTAACLMVSSNTHLAVYGELPDKSTKMYGQEAYNLSQTVELAVCN